MNDNNNVFYRKTNGLIKSDFVFYVSSFLLTENGIGYKGGIDSKIIIRLRNEILDISIIGGYDKYISSHLVQSITHTFIKEDSQEVEFFLSCEDYQDKTNIPGSLSILANNEKVSELCFFIVDEDLISPRWITLYGEGEWIDERDNNASIMTDFHFNIANNVTFNMKDKYLPVRAMTADYMGILGDVAIIACNPVIRTPIGRDIYANSFEMREYEDTEYFVFSKYKKLYNELKDKVLSMSTWEPDEFEYNTIKGWIHGNLRIVHIDRTLY